MASVSKRPNGQWRARYRDEAGKEHARHFARKVEGSAVARHGDGQHRPRRLRGPARWPDHRGVTTRPGWPARLRSPRDGTRRRSSTTRCGLHLLPALGALPMAAVRPDVVQGLVPRSWRTELLGRQTIRNVYDVAARIFERGR